MAVAAVFGGAPGLLIGSLIHGRGWVAVVALVVVAGVSAILARLGGIGSATGLQLLVYCALCLGPARAAAALVAHGAGVPRRGRLGAAAAHPGWLLSPRSPERGPSRPSTTPSPPPCGPSAPRDVAARRTVTAALNAAYDALLTVRSSSSGRSGGTCT